MSRFPVVGEIVFTSVSCNRRGDIADTEVAAMLPSEFGVSKKRAANACAKGLEGGSGIKTIFMRSSFTLR